MTYGLLKKKKKYQKKFPKQEASERDADTGKYINNYKKQFHAHNWWCWV